jgi:Zn-dependent protease
MRRRWRLGRIGGVPVYADSSLLFIALLLTFDLWAILSDRFRYPQLSQGAALSLSVLGMVLFLLSILAHELAHAAMFRARGIPVRDITLYMFGGATSAVGEAKRPVDEFLVTVVGPATTAVLGLGFLALHALGGSFLSRPLQVGVFGLLAEANLLMAVFNLLPGLPLDGGRILLSGVWKATGDRVRATRVTARTGQGVGVAIVVAGVLLITVAHNLFFGLWAAFIGWFLFRAATATVAEADRDLVRRSATAREVMGPPPPAIPADVPAGVAVQRYLWGHDGEAFPVMEDGHVAGFTTLRAAAGLSPDTPIREAMARTAPVVEAGPDETMDVVADRLGKSGGQAVMVLQAGRLIGVIERGDVARLLERGGPPVRVPPRPDAGLPG